MADPQLIRCDVCGVVNRVERAKLNRGLAPVCGRCKRPLPAEDKPLTITDATFSVDVERSVLPVLLDAWAPWCGPCQMVSPIVEALAGELAGRVRVAKLNVDENPTTAESFDLRSIPTLLVLKACREVDRIVGAQPKAEIRRWLERAMA
jgi:thioredoxin 2